MTKDSLTSIIFDRFPLLDDFTLIGGLPTTLSTLVLAAVVPQAKHTKKDYCTFIFQLLSRLVSLSTLETVHVKLALHSPRLFFEAMGDIEDKLDKDVMSLTKHILTSRKQSLKIWNVFYPVKAGYLKTMSHALETFFFWVGNTVH